MVTLRKNHRLAFWAIGIILPAVAIGTSVLLPQQNRYPLLASGDHPSAMNQIEVLRTDSIYIPAVVLPLGRATAPQPTRIATPSPTSLPTETPITEPTQTSTPDAPNTLRFEGTSSQQRLVFVETLPDLSAVINFEMDAQIICPNNSGLVEIAVSDQIGYEIRGDRFQIRVSSLDGNEHVILGALDSDGSRMHGSWSIWLDGTEPILPCNGKGAWSAVRQSP